MSRPWNISCSKCYISEIFHIFNVKFLKHIMFLMSRFWNVLRFERHVSEKFHVLNVIFLKHFMFSYHVSETCFARHVSKTFHILNVPFLKHFKVQTLRFKNSSYFECQISETFHALNVTFLKQCLDIQRSFVMPGHIFSFVFFAREQRNAKPPPLNYRRTYGIGLYA